jgi:hypothetical protein
MMQATLDDFFGCRPAPNPEPIVISLLSDDDDEEIPQIESADAMDLDTPSLRSDDDAMELDDLSQFLSEPDDHYVFPDHFYREDDDDILEFIDDDDDAFLPPQPSSPLPARLPFSQPVHASFGGSALKRALEGTLRLLSFVGFSLLTLVAESPSMPVELSQPKRLRTATNPPVSSVPQLGVATDSSRPRPATTYHVHRDIPDMVACLLVAP